MTKTSSRMGWPYPSENDDPWYAGFKDFVSAADLSAYASREDRQLVITEGGTVAWSAGTSSLSWSDDLKILSPIMGRVLTVAAATVTLDDGKVLYATLVRAPTTNSTVNVAQATQVPTTDQALLLAARVGTRVYWRNGLVMNDGDSFLTVGASQGGGGGTDVNAIHDNVAAEIQAIAEKVTPASADLILIEDSALAYNKKKVQVGSLTTTPTAHASTHEPGGGDALTVDAAAATGSLRTLGTGAQQACAGNDSRLSDNRTDADAIHDNVAAEISAIASKATPTASDYLIIEDAADSNNKKSITIGALPGGGGTDVRAANIVIGNAANGDTSAVCDALDTGNGTLLKSTIEGASAGDLIFVRAGTYDLGAGPQTRITIPVGVRVVCAGRGATIIKAWTGADGRAIRITDGELTDVTVEAPAPTVQTVAGDVVEADTTFARLHRVHVSFTGAWESVNPANVTIVAGFGFSNVELDVQDCKATGMSRGNDWAPFGSAAAAQQRGFDLDTCSGLMTQCRTTQGYYGFYIDSCQYMTFRDLRGEGHWLRGLYATGCFYSSFDELFFDQDAPPDFGLPPTSIDGIEFFNQSEVRVRGVTLQSSAIIGSRYGISYVSAGKHIMSNVLVIAGNYPSGGVSYDSSSDFNILTGGLIANGVVDAGTGNDIAHWILQ